MFTFLFSMKLHRKTSVPSITSDYQRSKYRDIVRSTVLYTGDPGFKS